MPVSRYGGRARTQFDQLLTGVALPASSIGSDPVLDLTSTDVMVLMGRVDYSPNPAVATDFSVNLLPDTQEGSSNWTAAASLPPIYAGLQRGVSGNVGYFVAYFDVKALVSARVRWSNANATNAAVINMWVARSLLPAVS